ncbi:unnamed protein product [Calypogeia fissa]
MDFTPSLHILAPSEGPPDHEKELCRERIHLLGDVEDILRRVMGLEGRLWLCSAFAELSNVVPPNVQTAVYLDLVRRATLRSSGYQSTSIARDQKDGDQVAKQIIRMMCESRPRQVARLLAQDSMMLRRFFSGEPKRALQWFQNFAGVGEIDHQLGARALARYVFMNREDSWHELVWKGDRSQAPAIVASKPHYFSDLDVVESIDNFLDHVPSFWQSEELRDSLEDGQFIALDVDFFLEELLAKMDSDAFSRILKAYLAEESFTVLCQRILPITCDEDFLGFVNGLASAMVKWKEEKSFHRDRKEEGEGPDSGKLKEVFWLEMVLSAGVEWKTLKDVIFCNACARNGRKLLRLMQSEEHNDETRLLDSLLADRNGYNEQEHWALRRECLAFRKWQAVQWLTLEAWLLFYRLSQENTPPEALEKLMTENGIGFLRTSAQHVEKSELDREWKGMKTHKEKKKLRKRHRRKREGKSRKRNKHSEDDDSESGSDVPFAMEESSRESSVSWRLSVDNYEIQWTKVDVMEHVVNDALSRWLQWTTKRW